VRRLAVLAALLATAAYPHDFYSPTAAAIKTAFGDKIKLKEGNGKLPTPDSLKSRELKFINADKSVDHGETFETEGNVRLTIGGYEISGDRVTGNKKTHVFVAEGNAKVTGGDGEVTGSMVQVDLRNNTFRFLDGRAKLGPTYTQGRTTGDVFIWSTDGGGKRSDFLANKGGLTTCDLEHPHFLLDARSIRVEPGKKATLRSIRLEILGKTILTIPYLVVPLLNNGDRYIPEVGQGPDEGYFIKTKFSTPLHGENYIDTRLDQAGCGPWAGLLLQEPIDDGQDECLRTDWGDEHAPRFSPASTTPFRRRPHPRHELPAEQLPYSARHNPTQYKGSLVNPVDQRQHTADALPHGV